MAGNKPKKYADYYHLVEPGRRFNVLSLDPYVSEGRLAMAYRYFPGPVATRFFLELRDHGRIFGLRCPHCQVVYVPPESTCGRCFAQLEDWVEVSPQGELLSYTVTHYSLPIHPGAAPVMYGLVKLDGADTALMHLLGETSPQTLKSGLRVEVVFRTERQGNILDLQYFRPVDRDL